MHTVHGVSEWLDAVVLLLGHQLRQSAFVAVDEALFADVDMRLHLTVWKSQEATIRTVDRTLRTLPHLVLRERLGAACETTAVAAANIDRRVDSI